MFEPQDIRNIFVVIILGALLGFTIGMVDLYTVTEIVWPFIG